MRGCTSASSSASAGFHTAIEYWVVLPRRPNGNISSRTANRSGKAPEPRARRRPRCGWSLANDRVPGNFRGLREQRHRFRKSLLHVRRRHVLVDRRAARPFLDEYEFGCVGLTLTKLVTHATLLGAC